MQINLCYATHITLNISKGNKVEFCASVHHGIPSKEM